MSWSAYTLLRIVGGLEAAIVLVLMRELPRSSKPSRKPPPTPWEPPEHLMLKLHEHLNPIFAHKELCVPFEEFELAAAAYEARLSARAPAHVAAPLPFRVGRGPLVS